MFTIKIGDGSCRAIVIEEDSVLDNIAELGDTDLRLADAEVVEHE